MVLDHPDPAALRDAIVDLQTLAGDYADTLSSYGRRPPMPARSISHPSSTVSASTVQQRDCDG